jgi:hypothetical protein
MFNEKILMFIFNPHPQPLPPSLGKGGREACPKRRLGDGIIKI